jgi:protein transport protein SEC24
MILKCEAVIKSLLERLPAMFAQTTKADNAMGKALQFALKMIGPIGGKIVVMNTTLPNLSDGALRQREDPKLYGTPKESQLLQPAAPYYKNFAVDCSRAQVSMDVFLFGGQYNDVATLSGLAKFTGGQVYLYPAFNGQSRPEDAIKFSTEFAHFLARPLGLEAVLRVRASKGIRMTTYHGNFFLRSTDLLALPNVSPDQSFAIEMAIDENLSGNLACFQTALLHTSGTGERRIRVITMALPITSQLAEVFTQADQFAIAGLLAKKGIP